MEDNPQGIIDQLCVKSTNSSERTSGYPSPTCSPVLSSTYSHTPHSCLSILCHNHPPSYQFFHPSSPTDLRILFPTIVSFLLFQGNANISDSISMQMKRRRSYKEKTGLRRQKSLSHGYSRYSYSVWGQWQEQGVWAKKRLGIVSNCSKACYLKVFINSGAHWVWPLEVKTIRNLINLKVAMMWWQENVPGYKKSTHYFLRSLLVTT